MDKAAVGDFLTGILRAMMVGEQRIDKRANCTILQSEAITTDRDLHDMRGNTNLIHS